MQVNVPYRDPWDPIGTVLNVLIYNLIYLFIYYVCIHLYLQQRML